jgi:DNA gyrase subunit A
MGVLTYNKSMMKKTGKLIGASIVTNDDEILLINSDGILIRIEAKGISKLGRATKGVRIMNVGDDARIIAMAKVVKEDEEESEKPHESEPQEGGAQDGPEQLGIDT